MSLATEDALERFNAVGTKLIFTDDSGNINDIKFVLRSRLGACSNFML